ncbi:MAG: DMT family transporter [Propionicimonas sp.]
MPEPARLRPALMMLAAAVLFGTTGTAQAFGPADANPLSVGAIRQVIGGTLLLVIVVAWWLRVHGGRLPRWSATKVGWVVLGGACVMAFQATFFFGTRGNGVAVGTVIALGSSPLFAGLFDWARGRRPSRRWLAATSLAVVGILLLSGAIGRTVALQPVGILASLVAGAAYAGYAVAAAEVVQRGIAALPATAAIIGTSGLLGAAVLPFTDNSWLAEPRGLAVALWLGGVTVVFSYLLMGAALQHLSASTAITLGLAEPLTAAILGVAVLGETLAPLQLAGVLLVLGGVVVAGTGKAVSRVPAVA